MTEDQLAGLGPELTRYLNSFRACFSRRPTFDHLGTYCRGLAKADETWAAWDKELGPSVELHAAAYAKDGRLGISWEIYRQRYQREMLAQKARIKALAARVRAGEIEPMQDGQADWLARPSPRSSGRHGWLLPSPMPAILLPSLSAARLNTRAWA